ncbi:hypothetical protein [Thiohalorhabdus sp.]|uniref:hypothetical protein n=1 Tax=Thiohalorhabdus sp. TaxID=3094134 RepID=UPI002FC31C29
MALEQASTTRAFAFTQAFFAAETAVQWGLYQVIAQGNSTSLPNGGLVFKDSDAAPAGLANCDKETGTLHTDLSTPDHHMGTPLPSVLL